MSTSSTKEVSPKRLFELLQQKQEPFLLEIYLHQRGCKKKSSRYEGNSFGCLFGSNKLSEESTKNLGLHGRRVKRNAAKICSRIGKDVCKKFVSMNEIIRMKNWNFSVGELIDDVKGRKEISQAMEDSGRLSLGSFSTDLNSCSESEADHKDVAAEKMAQWRLIEENKQCSPDSVLDEIEMISNVISFRHVLEEPPSRLSFRFPTEKRIWELLIRKREEKRESVGSWRNVISKRSVEETRQLLLDCAIKEAVEMQGIRKKGGGSIGTEELGKMICENIRCWDKQSVNVKKITKLVRSDLLNSYQQQEQYSLEGFREEIVKEIGDMILKEMFDEINTSV